MLMKMLGARGLAGYFRQTSNIFDFVVVMSSLPTLLQPMITGSLGDSNNLKALSAFRMFRLFRVFRIARLLHKVQSMRRMLATIFSSIAGIAHLSLFMLFILVTSAIMGTTLYARPYPPSPDVAQQLNDAGYSMYSGGEVPQFHFDNFLVSLLSMFIISTGAGAPCCACRCA